MIKPRNRKWTNEMLDQLKQEIQEHSVEEVGRMHGISRNRVYQLIGPVAPKRPKSIYKGIDAWLKEHKMTYREIANMMGYGPSMGNVTAVSLKLMGEREMKKWEIDWYLNLTGLTYEEAFCEG